MRVYIFHHSHNLYIFAPWICLGICFCILFCFSVSQWRQCKREENHKIAKSGSETRTNKSSRTKVELTAHLIHVENLFIMIKICHQAFGILCLVIHLISGVFLSTFFFHFSFVYISCVFYRVNISKSLKQTPSVERKWGTDIKEIYRKRNSNRISWDKFAVCL